MGQRTGSEGAATSGIIGSGGEQLAACSRVAALPSTAAARPLSMTRHALFMTTTRSAILATTPRSWVTKDHRHAGVALARSLIRPKHLRLRGHIQRRRRLVRDQQVGFGHHRHGDHRPLPHAARQFERISVARPAPDRQSPRCSNCREHLLARLGLRAARGAMQTQHFGHLVAQSGAAATASASALERSSRCGCP